MADSLHSQNLADGVTACDSRYRRMFDTAREGILFLDAATYVITDANPFIADLLGYPVEEFIGKELWEIGLLDKPACLSAFRELQEKKFICYQDVPIQTKTVRRRVELTGRLYEDDGSPFVQCNVVASEAAVDNSQARLRLALDAARLGTFDWNMENDRIIWSGCHEELWGYAPGEFDGTFKAVSDRFHQDDIPEIAARMEQCIATREHCLQEFRVVWPDKSVHWIKATGELEFDSDGTPLRMLGAVRDITESKLAVKALRESEERTRRLVRAASVGLWEWDLLTDAVYFSPEWKQQIGYADDEIVNKFEEWQTRVHPDDIEGVLAAVSDFREGTVPQYSVEIRMLHRDGSWRWIHSDADFERNEKGEPVKMMGSHIDITERMRAEEALRQSHELMHLATEATGVGIWQWHVPTNRIRWDAQMFKIYGITQTESGFIDYTTWSGAVRSEDLSQQEEQLQNIVNSRGSGSREFRINRDSDGESRYIHAVETVRTNTAGETEWVVGTNLDVTERKLAEEALSESLLVASKAAAMQTSILNALPANVALLDEQGVVLSVNETWRQFDTTNMMGGSSFGVGQNYLEVCDNVQGDCAEDAEKAAVGIRSVLLGEADSFGLEYPCHSPTEPLWYRLIVAPLREGRLSGAVVMHLNITDRKLAEDAQRESQDLLVKSRETIANLGQRLELAVKGAGFGVWELDLTCDRLIWDDGMHELYGFARGEFDGSPDQWRSTIHPDDRELVDARFAELLAGKGVQLFAFRALRHNDGAIRHIEANGAAEMDESGRVWRLVGMNRDVTEQLQSREDLRRITQLLEASQAISKTGGWEIDLATNDLYWTAETYLLHDTTPEEYNPTLDGGVSFYLPECRPVITAAVQAAMERGEGFDLILEILTAKGRRIDVRATCTVTLRNGRPAKLTGIFQDITENKQAEEKLIGMRDDLQLAVTGYERVLDNSLDMICSVDGEGRFSAVSSASINILGYEPQELIGKLYIDLVHPDDHGITVEVAADIMAGKAVTNFENRYLHKDGRVIPVMWSAKWLESEKTMFAVARDISKRKKSEDELRLLEACVSRLNDIVLITEAEPIDSPGPRILFVNDAFERRTGYSREEVIGETPRLLQGPKTQRDALDRIRTALKAWEPVREELINYTKSGEELWLELDIVPVANASGWYTHWVAIERDITERKRGEQERTRLAGLLEQSLNEIYIFSTDTLCFEYVNASAQRNLGYDLDQLRTMTPLDLKPEFAEESFREMVGPLLRRETHLLTFQTIHQRADGTSYDVEVHLQLSGPPDQQVFLAMILDVTERKKLDIALRESEERYRLLFQHNPFPMWVYDIEKLRFLNANDAAIRFYGYSREEFLAKTIKDIRPKEDIPALLDNIANTTSAINNAGVWKHLKKDGSLVDIEVVSQELTYGERAARLVLANDVTEKMLAESRIQSLNEELEQRVLNRTAQLNAVNSELESFAYSVSHDLRAPLRHVNGFSLALLEDYSDRLDDAGKNYLNEIRGASREMGTLIDDLLDLSRVTRSTLRRESVDLSEIARRVVTDLRKDSKHRDVRIVIEDGMTAIGDRNLLQVILVNLIGNAWKFTSKTESAEISVGSEVRPDEIEYFVRDNGAGFDMAYAGKLFGAFQRLHNGTAFEGSGIGLATVKRIINRHGGTVRAIGEVGKGATFYFTLPINKEEKNGEQGDIAG